MFVDTFYYLIKLYKKECVSRLRKKRLKVQKKRDEEKYKRRSTLTFKLGPTFLRSWPIALLKASKNKIII